MIKTSKFFLPYIILLLVLGFKGEIIISIIMVFCHEMVHYISAKVLGFEGLHITFSAMGGSLHIKEIDEAEPIEDIIISLSGPMFNFAMAIVFHFLFIKYELEVLYIIYSSNLSIGIFNLIPVIPLDGARILRSIFRMKTIFKKANEYVIYISLTIGYVMAFIYLIMFFKDIYNITFGIVVIFVIYISKKEKEKLAYLIMGDIVQKRSKFLKRGYIENRSVSIRSAMNLLEVIGLVEKNKYTLFYVLDDNMNVFYTFSENNLIEALKNYGNITVKELLEKPKE